MVLPIFAYYVGYLLDRPNHLLAWPAFWLPGAVGTAYNLVSLVKEVDYVKVIVSVCC